MSRQQKLEREIEEQLWWRRIARASAFSDVTRRVAWSSMAVAVAILGVQQLAPDLWAQVRAWVSGGF